MISANPHRRLGPLPEEAGGVVLLACSTASRRPSPRPNARRLGQVLFVCGRKNRPRTPRTPSSSSSCSVDTLRTPSENRRARRGGLPRAIRGWVETVRRFSVGRHCPGSLCIDLSYRVACLSPTRPAIRSLLLLPELGRRRSRCLCCTRSPSSDVKYRPMWSWPTRSSCWRRATRSFSPMSEFLSVS